MVSHTSPLHVHPEILNDVWLETQDLKPTLAQGLRRLHGLARNQIFCAPKFNLEENRVQNA